MSLTQTSAPATEPVTTIEAKTHLHYDDPPLGADVLLQDAYIDQLIAAARQWCEVFTNRVFVTQTWEWRLDAFPGGAKAFDVPKAKLSSVTSIAYLDVDGASQTLATSVYQEDANSQPGRIALKWNQAWPSVRGGGVIDVVTVTFVAGYGAASAVPAPIKHAISLLVGHWHANRESVVTGVVAKEVPQTVEMLLWPYRLLDMAA